MSPFLRLPRELRDRIYKHALYNPDGVVCEGDKRGVIRVRRRPPVSRPTIILQLRKILLHLTPGWTRMHRSEANQLKYVCRQLHRETRHLVLHLNRLVLEDDGRSNPLGQCLCLLHSASLRQVTITCCGKTFENDYSKMALSAISAYCQKNVAVSVRVRIPHWSQTHPDFVLQGASYLLAFRKDSSLTRPLAVATSVSYLSDLNVGLDRMEMPMPSNLRWLPREEVFDSKLFGRVVSNHHLLGLQSVHLAVPGLRELAEGWFMYGL